MQRGGNEEGFPGAGVLAGLLFAFFTVVLGGVIWFAGLGLLAAIGIGQAGVAAVTGCESSRGEKTCYGDFQPDGGGAVHRDVRVDGLGHDAEGERIDARMVVDGRVEAIGSYLWLRWLVGFVVVGFFWLAFGHAVVVRLGLRPRRWCKKPSWSRTSGAT
ncbi:hypothetical protein [Actinomadura sp. 6N118]|uniref:hypothetical protein n=1 Tax=Actinomadura sp. 6N118 TaxID=3375151 RepID=UPI0037926C59